MTEFTERNYLDDWLKHEAEGGYSRSMGVLAESAAHKSGTVLGRVLTGAAVSAAKTGGNTGTGTLVVDATTPVLAGAVPGVYKVRFVTDTVFKIEAPDGKIVGTYAIGGADTNTVTVSEILKFVLTQAATVFVIGDGFDITVAEGSGKYVAFDQDGVNGEQIAAGILARDADASAADADAVILARDAIVIPTKLIWPDTIEAGEKTAALADLAALGIISDRVEA